MNVWIEYPETKPILIRWYQVVLDNNAITEAYWTGTHWTYIVNWSGIVVKFK